MKKTILLLLTAFLALVICSAASATTVNDNLTTSQMQVPFTENQGQVADDSVKYDASTQYADVSVKDDSINYAVSNNNKTTVIKESFSGSKNSEVNGIDKSSTTVNYYIGSSENWITNVPAYNTVGYENLYPGIDLTLKAYNDNTEKIFTISPGANPNSIKMLIENSKGLQVNENGELEILTSIGILKMTTPFAFQIINGVKVAVPVEYQIFGNAYGYSVGKYNKGYSLTIDPKLMSTYFGADRTENAGKIAINQNTGDVYICGNTNSYSGFLFPSGSYDTSYNSNMDVFVARFNNALTSLKSLTYFGGSNKDSPTDILVDPTGFVYLLGYTLSNNLPTKAGAFDRSYNGGWDTFVAKFSSGLGILYNSTYFGGKQNDLANAIARDIYGNIYITGGTTSYQNFTTTSGAYDRSYNLKGDVFVSKFTPSLSILKASTFFGWDSNEGARDMVIDKTTRNVWITGTTNQTGGYGGLDILLAGFNYNLTKLIDARHIGDENNNEGFGIDLGQNGVLYIAGYSDAGNGDVTLDAVNKTSREWTGHLDSSSTVKTGTAEGYEHPYDIAIDQRTGNIYVTGITQSTNFPGIWPADRANGDAFVACYKSDFSSQDSASYTGGSGTELATGIAINQVTGDVYILGQTNTSDGGAATPGAFDPTYNGDNGDAFVTRFTSKLN